MRTRANREASRSRRFEAKGQENGKNLRAATQRGLWKSAIDAAMRFAYVFRPNAEGHNENPRTMHISNIQRRKTMRVNFKTLAFAVLFISVSLWAADDPVIGTWKIDLAKSKFSPGPPPKSMINKYEPSGDGVIFTQDIVDAQGKSIRIQYTATYDGKSHPSTGDDSRRDTVAWKPRSDPHNSEGVITKGGKVTSTLRRVISKDGKTMTITSKGTDPGGQRTSSVHFFNKVE